MKFSQDIEDAIAHASQQSGMSPDVLRRFVSIESSGNPLAVTGSYKGALQLSASEFAKHGSGDIFSARDNILAGARKLQRESVDFAASHGRAPDASDLYMVHQQGAGGYARHLQNPSIPAWQNMANTAEGRAKGEGWAKKAIWGNVPDQMKGQYGSVDNMTSQQFTDMWKSKVNDGKFARSGSVAPTAMPDSDVSPSNSTMSAVLRGNAPQQDPREQMNALSQRVSNDVGLGQPSDIAGILRSMQQSVQAMPQQQFQPKNFARAPQTQLLGPARATSIDFIGGVK
jgi:hypothetical protein